MKKVISVKSVPLRLLKTNPTTLEIHAEGEVSSGGWGNGQLIPYVYIVPPKDGIYEFDFVADTPTRPATTVISPIKADYFWQPYPNDLKGVRIYASSNCIEELIEEDDSKLIFDEVDVNTKRFESALEKAVPKSRLTFLMKYSPKNALVSLRSLKVKKGDGQFVQLLEKSVRGVDGEISCDCGIYADQTKLEIEWLIQAFTKIEKAKVAIVQNNPESATVLESKNTELKPGKTWKGKKTYVVK